MKPTIFEPGNPLDPVSVPRPIPRPIQRQSSSDLQHPTAAQLSCSTQPTSNEQDQELLPVATLVDNVHQGEEVIIDGVLINVSNTSKKIMLEITALLFTSTVVIMLVVFFKTNHEVNDEHLGASSLSPSISLQPSVSLSPSTFINYDDIVEKIAIQVSGEEILKDHSSIQFHTWKTMAKMLPFSVEKEIVQVNDTQRLIQRYALSVLEFSGYKDLHISPHLLQIMIENPFDECSLPTLVCNENSQVTSYVSMNERTTAGGGIIASEIGALSQLRHFTLSNRDIEGTLPSEFGDLKHLRILDLSGNFITGSIPIQIWQLKRLEFMNMSTNFLNGTLSSNIGDLESLELLDLSNNALSGSIPLEIASMSMLKGLRLQNNSFSGNANFFCAMKLNLSQGFFFDITDEVDDISYNFESGFRFDCA